MKQIFADANYWIALLNPRDNLHTRALEVSNDLQECRIITSEMVLTELLNSLAQFGEELRRRAADSVKQLKSDPNVRVVPQTSVQFNEAMKRYVERPDKEWGLTDCSSFLIMESEGIQEVLAYDKHFVQAGFRALLREESL